jgi:hypothetical protein
MLLLLGPGRGDVIVVGDHTLSDSGIRMGNGSG